MRRPKIQTLLVKAFDYNDNGTVSTAITVKLSRVINLNEEKISLTYADKQRVNAEPIDHNGYGNPSGSENKRINFRIFRFNLENLPLNYQFNYSIYFRHLGSRKKHAVKFSFLKFQKIADPNETISKAKNLQLVTPATKKGQKAELIFATAGDQEVVREIDKRIPSISRKVDNRKATQKIYQHLHHRQPNLFVHLSDIYHGESLTELQVKEYDSFHQHIEKDFGELTRSYLSSISAVRILDDHDFGKNNLKPSDFKPNDPANSVNIAIQVFQELWPVPNNGDPNGLYYETQYGDIHCFYLQTRIYAENGNLLGQEQLNWLESRLRDKNIKSHPKLIFSPLPFVMGKKPEEDHRQDRFCWEHLLTLFAETGVKGIFCADSHNYSRTDIHIKLKHKTVIIPHYIVGTLGGVGQAPTHNEYKRMKEKQIALLPTNYDGKISARVHTYYGLKRKVSRSFRLIKNGEEITNKSLDKRAYGYLDVSISRPEDSDPGGSASHRKMTTKFFVFQKSNSDHFILDEEIYPCSDAEDEDIAESSNRGNKK